MYSPASLDISAESPEEIAVSIASEIIAVFRNRKGVSLRKLNYKHNARQTLTF